MTSTDRYILKNMALRTYVFKGCGHGNYLCYAAIFERPTLPPFIVILDHSIDQRDIKADEDLEDYINNIVNFEDLQERLALSIYNSTPALSSSEPNKITWARSSCLRTLQNAKRTSEDPDPKDRCLIEMDMDIEKMKWHWEYKKIQKESFALKAQLTQ